MFFRNLVKNLIVSLFFTGMLVSSHIKADNLSNNSGSEQIKNYLDCPCPHLIAHRGASGIYPDSSELAFSKALELNSDILELDVHLSKDGQIIINHDDSLLRTTGQDILIHEAALDEIKTANAGFTFKSKENGYPFRELNLKVLTLEDFFRKFPQVRFNIEMKKDSIELAEKLHNFVKKHKLESRVVVASKYSQALEHYRKLSGQNAMTSAHVYDVVYAYLAWIFNLEIRGETYELLQLPYQLVNQSMVQYFQSQGKLVHVWTVNNPDDIEEMLTIGVDGVMTDHPELAWPIFVKTQLR